MGNDIQISVRVSNDTAGGLAAVNTSLRGLKNNAQQAGNALNGLAAKALATAAAMRTLHAAIEDNNRALRTLRGRAAAAAVSLTDLRNSANGTNNSLRTLNTRAQTADGRLNTLSTRTRALRGDMDDLDGSVNTLNNRLGGLRSGLGGLPGITMRSGDGMDRLRGAAIALSPALIPIAAAAVPIAAGLGAATVAMGAFGLAIGGQIAGMLKATEAEKKYKDAVKEHGKSSDQAVKAEAEHLRQVKALDPATRRAAAALGVFKDQYKAWSTSLAGDTMPVFTKGLATFGGLLPRLTPLVKGTSTELDRLMTVLAGGVNSSGFEKFMNTFAEFASGALSKATDGLVRFMRTMSGGAGSSQFTEFMAYVREVGPAVGETLGNLGRAFAHLVAAASDVGVGLLSVINAFASLVNAIPTEALGALLQFVVVFKAVKLAAAGLGGAGGAIAAFGTSLAAMQAASIAAGGGLRGLAAAFGVMSRAAKVAVIGTGIGLLVVALSELADIGKRAPVNVDKMATSLGQFAKSGKLSGEALRISGKDFKAFDEAMSGMVDRGTWDKMQQGFTNLFGQDSTPVKRWKADLDDIDKGLEQMVKDGNADLAAAALKRYIAHAKENGHTSEEVTRQLGDYRSALADLNFEQQLVADSMGLFGDQALAVQGKLDAQKSSADGLRQAIQALADTHRAAFDAETKFEQSVDAIDEALKNNGKTLDVNTEKGRANRDALSGLAAATHEAAAASRESTGSWEGSISVYERGRKKFIEAAEAMGLGSEEARKLADELLNIPSPKMRIEMDKEDAQRGLDAFTAAVEKSPKSKSVTLKTLSKSAEQILEGFGFKVKRLPNGSVKITANGGQALGTLAAVKAARDSLRDKTITFTTHYRITGNTARRSGTFGSQLANADGSVTDYYANGGIRSFANGSENHVAQLAPAGAMRVWAEPETGGEAYIPLADSKRARSMAILEEVADRFGVGLQKFARGGVSRAEREARSGARGELTVSHFGRMAGYQRSEFGSALSRPDSVGSLVNALNQWRSIILKATHGGTEKNLLKQLDSTGKSLLKHEKNLEKVNKQLDSAKSKLSDLKNAASSLASSVKSNILGSANITRGAGGDRAMTTAGIMGGLIGSRDKATAFAKALKDLKAKGLSKDLLAQVAEAGIDGGGLETAGALLGASGSEIKSMNALQAEISKAAGAAGKTTADAVYGAQIKAQEKLIKDLKAEQSKLTKAMDKLTKAMEKAIEKAFGGKASGGIVGAASGGIRGGMTWVGEQGPELVRLPVGSRVYPAGGSRRAWDSMLNSAPGSGGGGGPIVIEFRSSGSEFDEFLMKSMRRSVRNLGSDVQFIFTGRKAP